MTSTYSPEAIRKTAEWINDTCTLHPEWNFIDERPMRKVEATKVFFQHCDEAEREEILGEAFFGKTGRLVSMTMAEFWQVIEAYLELTINDDVSDVVWEIHKEREWAA